MATEKIVKLTKDEALRRFLDQFEIWDCPCGAMNHEGSRCERCHYDPTGINVTGREQPYPFKVVEPKKPRKKK